EARRLRRADRGPFGVATIHATFFERRMNITSFVQRAFLFLALLSAPLAWGSQQVIPAPPQLAATSYVLMDAVSGQILVENNGDERLPPASLTKLMTAYIATLEINRGQIKEG